MLAISMRACHVVGVVVSDIYTMKYNKRKTRKNAKIICEFYTKLAEHSLSTSHSTLFLANLLGRYPKNKIKPRERSKTIQ